MDEMDPGLERIVDAARRPVRSDPAARARVLAAVRESRRPGALRRALEWLVRPRAVHVSPLGALAAVTALLLVPATLLLRDPGGPGRPPATRTDGLVRTVRFELVAPGARRVSLVGDFNEWDPAATPLRAVGRGGVWAVEVPLEVGRYTYSFVVDGSAWRGDPAAPPVPEDDFGRPSSVILVQGRT